MITLWRVSLFRSWLSFTVFAVLYALLYLQLAIYLYLGKVELLESALVTTGYQIGLYGFTAGVLAIHFLAIKNYAYEMGNLETLGYTRLRYGLFYFIQFLITLLIGTVAGVAFFQVLYARGAFEEVQTAVLASLHWAAFWRLGSGLSIAYIVFFYAVSFKDPVFLLKEKA